MKKANVDHAEICHRSQACLALPERDGCNALWSGEPLVRRTHRPDSDMLVCFLLRTTRNSGNIMEFTSPRLDMDYPYVAVCGGLGPDK